MICSVAEIAMSDLVEKYRDGEKFMALCRQCRNYGANWACPPLSFDVEEFLERYTYAYILGVKIVHDEKALTNADSHERAMEYSARVFRSANARLLEILHGLEKKFPGSIGLSAGQCGLCGTCARTSGTPCRFPEKMRHSFEVLGFDISRVAEALLGMTLVWMRKDDPRETFLPPYQVLVNALFTSRPDGAILDEVRSLVA